MGWPTGWAGIQPLPIVAKLQTLKAVDPVTGAAFSRRTARTYVAAVVFTGSQGQPICDSWCGRPDLAQAALAKALRAWPSARLAPVAEPTPAAPAAEPVATPAPALWGEAVACEALQALADPGATPARPLLPGEALPPEPPAQAGPAPQLPRLQAQAWQARPATAADLPPADRPAWMLAPWAGQSLPELRAWHPAG